MTSSLNRQLESLEKVKSALRQISKSLSPYLSYLQHHNESDGQSSNEKEKYRAEIEVSISLAIGTLKYMAARLKGCNVKPGDPLRLELDNIRKILKQVKKGRDTKSDEQNQRVNGKKNKSKKEDVGRRSVIDKEASKRIIKAALSESTQSQTKSSNTNDSNKRKLPEYIDHATVQNSEKSKISTAKALKQRKKKKK